MLLTKRHFRVYLYQMIAVPKLTQKHKTAYTAILFEFEGFFKKVNWPTKRMSAFKGGRILCAYSY